MTLVRRLTNWLRADAEPESLAEPTRRGAVELEERLRESEKLLHASDARRAAELAEQVRAQAGDDLGVQAKALVLGVRALHAMGRYEDALARVRELTALRPSPEASILLAQELHFTGETDDALRILDALVAAQPTLADAWRGRGHVLLAAGRAREALEAYERVFALVGATPDGLANKAAALQRLGDARSALRAVDTALRLMPAHRRAIVNRVGVLIALMRLDEAANAARDGLRLFPDDPELHWNLGIVLLLQGDLRQGWAEHEWRLRVPAFRSKTAALPQPHWRGEDLRGRTIALCAEQGFGDSLQFVRFVPAIAARAKSVYLLVPSALQSLFQGMAPNCFVVGPDEALPACDFQCALPSLPATLQIGLEDIPAPVPYLRADPARAAVWAARLPNDGRPAVGLVWSGSSRHANDFNRSIPLAALRQISGEHCRFVSLQTEIRDSDRAAYADWPGLLRWGEELPDFAETAALVSSLDLVITVDTSVAHLAGALGRPVWILLPSCPDWRWMIAREDSPWYPSARLFRQPLAGDWMPVLAHVRRELTRLQPEPIAPAGEAASECIRAGNAALGGGDLVAAVASYRRAAALAPHDPMPRVNLGYALLEQGETGSACEVLEQAVVLGGGADASYLLAQAHAAQGDWSAARDGCLAALVQRPDFGFAWRDLAAAQEQLGERQQALQAFENALRHAPELEEVLPACVRLQLESGDLADALVNARRWVERGPEDWEAHFALGQVLLALDAPADALACMERASRLGSANPAVAFATGNALFRLARFDAAATAYERALAQDAGWTEAQLNRAIALDRAGRHPDALASLERVLAQEPKHKKALYQRPMVLVSLDRIPEALEAVATARRLLPDDPDMEWHYAFAHLLAGRMKEGWPAYEARWRAADTGARLARQPFAQPLWTGQPLAGKALLVYPEQGLGDMLQFARFLAELEAKGARVLLWSPASLQDVLGTVSPTVMVATRVQDLPSFDYHCPIMSLPLAFGTTLETIPARVPYIRSNEALRARWRARLGEKKALRVGVVWSGNAAHANDRNRSIPLQDFAAIAAAGCEFVSLQNAVREQDRAALASWEGLVHFGEELASFGDTAALADLMDVVVSVDTSVAHLAGALARPLFVLLPARPDWRWMLKREDSPWYPTARLFRQSAPGAWEPVLLRVREQLLRLAR